MKFSEAVMQYYKQLDGPTNLPDDVEVLNPFKSPIAFDMCTRFYHKYYNDFLPRIMLFGINPGRFGAGLTGIPFTDPVSLQEHCQITNDLEKRQELSSKFIYQMISAFGGPQKFYELYYISAISPLGYIRNGINLNYYDIKGFKIRFESYVCEQIEKQLQFGIDQKVAFSIGKGENFKYLRWINLKHKYFEEVHALPHPRWVMQYRLKRKEEFIDEYLQALNFTRD